MKEPSLLFAMGYCSCPDKKNQRFQYHRKMTHASTPSCYVCRAAMAFQDAAITSVQITPAPPPSAKMQGNQKMKEEEGNDA
mmetsp:Transcript_2274/g.5686  ORF Transcript_2274/g.5686 Transcript_2274/m.5686 type:complete len:81 (-) Transcript_2274:975-1217(-)